MDERRIIVAGIDTDAGKTVVSAILCEALLADYWKPVQAGDLNNSDSLKVGKWVSNDLSYIHTEAFRLTQPMSPHAAADIDNTVISQDDLVIPETENRLVVELAGGLMVPLRKDYLIIDWVKQSGLPVILVSKYYLGSINHTLLSWEALTARNIPVVGIVFNGDKNQSTFDVIMDRTQAKCLLEIPTEPEINARIIRKHADHFHL